MRRAAAPTTRGLWRGAAPAFEVHPLPTTEKSYVQGFLRMEEERIRSAYQGQRDPPREVRFWDYAKKRRQQTVFVRAKTRRGGSTKGAMWGYPVFVLGAISSFLEPFRGHLLPKIDKVSEELTLRYHHEEPWVGATRSRAKETRWLRSVAPEFEVH